MNYKALLFDLNGTMIDDMDYHVKAWHTIFNDLGANISLERMKEECYGKNHEVIERILPGRFSEVQKTQMSLAKETAYQEAFKPHLKLINGLDEFLNKAYRQNIPMAIGSAAIMSNIDFVLDGLNIRKYFSAIVSAEDVSRSKPDPETYLKCARALKVTPVDCLVFEDAPKGVESAFNAGMRSVVLTILHQQHEFDRYNNIVAFGKDYTDKGLSDFFKDNLLT
ncbi:MAG TPA: HAD family phosphatase [Chitinophagaceae bacterium]|nr:HAD family phosphatase [Chitinophagaceae bacterium]